MCICWRCQLPDYAGLPVISIFTSLFAGVCQLPGGAVVLWHLQRDANYPMMQGSLSPLYLQAVCQLPSGAVDPWPLQKDASYPMMLGSLSPYHLYIAVGLPTTQWYLALRKFHFCKRFANYPAVPGCGAPFHLYIYRRIANFPMMPASCHPFTVFAGGLPTIRWCRAPCHQYTPSPGPSSQPSSLWHSGYLSYTGLSYTNMW